MDLTAVIKSNMMSESRNTGMLHCSSHLTAPLRHTQLYMSGKYEQAQDFMGSVRMYTGTMWHERIEKWLSGTITISEVDLTPYLSFPWTGRADFLIWDGEKFVVNDLKTTKAEGIAYLKGKPKEDHIWQVSAYVMGASLAGLPVDTERAIVYYLPMNVIPGQDIQPVALPFDVLPFDVITDRMHNVYDSVIAYNEGQVDLAPEPDPEPRLFKDAKRGIVDVKMVPHWSNMYCPYPEVCGCNEQRPFKVGHFDAGEYVPRKGYEEYTDMVKEKFDG